MAATGAVLCLACMWGVISSQGSVCAGSVRMDQKIELRCIFRACCHVHRSRFQVPGARSHVSVPSFKLLPSPLFTSALFHPSFINADNRQTCARCTCLQIVDGIFSDLGKDLCTNMSCSSFCRILRLLQSDMALQIASVDQAVQALKTWVDSPEGQESVSSVSTVFEKVAWSANFCRNRSKFAGSSSWQQASLASWAVSLLSLEEPSSREVLPCQLRSQLPARL